MTAHAAGADEKNLLRGLSMYHATSFEDASGGTKTATDGNLSTYLSLNENKMQGARTTLWYEFDEPKFITTIGASIRNNDHKAFFRYWTEDGKIAGSTAYGTKPVLRIDKKVKRVGILHSGSGETQLAEFEAWGYETMEETPPNELTATATHNQVSLRWKEIPGATNYRLFVGMQNLVNSPSVLAYTHRGLAQDTEYIYTLETTDKYAQTSQTTITVRTAEEPPLEAPKLTGKIGYKSATLHIDHPGGVKGYRLYQDGTALPDLYSDTTIKIDNLIGGKEYAFYVTAISEAGKESEASNQVRVTPADVPPPAAPVLSVTPGDRSAILTIQTPAQRLLAGATTQYRVYQDGKALAGLHTTNRIIVNGLKNDTEYAFHIVAIGAYGLESEASNTAKVKPEAKPLPGTGIDSGSIEWGMTPGDILESGGSVVLMLSSFILLGIVVMYVPRLIRLLKTAVKP